MKKVLFITNIHSSYRINFFYELGKYVDLTVWFESNNHKERVWKINGLCDNFRYEILKGYNIENMARRHIEIIGMLQ